MTIHKHTLKESGVKLVSAMENIPDSPEGIILESLLEGLNNKNGQSKKYKKPSGFNEERPLNIRGRSSFLLDLYSQIFNLVK